MPFKRDIHHRQSIRLRGYDYARAGAYFVTICAYERECLFGAVVGGEVRLNGFGEIVRGEWLKTATVRTYVTLDEFVIMPNHLHGILMIDDVGATRWVARNETPPKGRATRWVAQNEMPPKGRATRWVAPTSDPASGSIGAIIGQFKSAATKRINEMRANPGGPVWQRNYYEHVIRGDDDLEYIREYICRNPVRWAEDEENPTYLNGRCS